MTTNPISTNAVYGTATTKPVKELARTLIHGKVYSYLDADMQKKWDVQFDHARLVRVRPTIIVGVTFLVLAAPIIALLAAGQPLALLPLGILGTCAIGFPIHEVVMYRKGKKVANEEVTKQKFEDILQQIQASIQKAIDPLRILHDTIQIQENSD
ncbi:MAG: hypothetical protein K940chlam9_00438 [Chlamydiae bacterium]|nr:hypothetical protein [Chlamydiota bacterium]